MKKHAYLITSLSLLLVFIIFTIIFKTVDVQYTFGNYYLGLHEMNYGFGNWATQFGKYESMAKLSDVLLYVSFGYVAVFAIVGVYQLIKNKSFLKVNKNLYALLGAYVAIVVIYFIFEIAKLNYSPDTSNGLKASYPSSHVFIGCSFYLINTFTAIKMLHPEKKWVEVISYGGALVICVWLTFTRALSLKHWISDIIASVILVSAVYFAYVYVFKRLFEKEVVKEIEQE